MEDKLLEGLDAEQRAALLTGCSRVLVVAPPGSGKTRVLSARFARLISVHGPCSVLAITFTNRAANEMEERVRALSGALDDLNIGTFHGFCLAFLKRRRPGFELYGREEALEVLRSAGVRNPEAAADRVSLLKNLSPFAGGSVTGDDAELLALYKGAMKEAGALDLDDLVLETIKCLEENSGEKLFDHVLVDEFQDVNIPQARLLRLMADSGSTLFAIGDPDQSIYGFRGAGVRAFEEFIKDYPGAEVITLRRNYRSGASIVKATDSLIRNNPGRVERETVPVRTGGEVRAVTCPDDASEAAFIAKEIESLMGGIDSLSVRDSEDARFSDFAVLARTNRLAEEIASALRRSAIPFQLIGPAEKGISSLLAGLRKKEVPKGSSLRDYITAEAQGSGLEADSLKMLLKEADSFLEANPGIEGGAALKAFLEAMALRLPADSFEIASDRVCVMTMHMTKGLEFDNVFIAGVEDGSIPLRFGTPGGSGDCGIEEERRLFYVAMTRARRRLYLLTSLKRRVRGEVVDQRPSPFLGEIPCDLIERVQLERKKAKKRPLQKGLFE